MEKEKRDVSLLNQIIKENDIRGLLVDLDNTVLHTSRYYIETENSLSLVLTEKIFGNDLDKGFADAMADIMARQYLERNRKPIPVTDRYMHALEEYLGFDEAQVYRDFVLEYLKNFYEVSPEIIDGALDVLRMIIDLELPYVYTSNAQESWTAVKVQGFELELGVNDIKYNAIDIDRVKDDKDWIASSEIIDIPVERALIIGDSLDADILAGICAGCRNLVWIGGDRNKLPSEIMEDSDIHIWCVDSIKDLV